MLIKYLAYLKSKQRDTGFTLIELLVVVVIMGILTAIAIPNFLSGASKAKQTEAKTTIGSINRAQVVYRTEGKGFARDMDSLGLGLPTSTQNYAYEMSVSSDGAGTTAIATPKDASLKGYSGGAVMFTGKTNNSAIATVLCEVTLPGITKPAPPTLQSGANTPEIAAICGEGQNQL
jgi:type IV pilus assembly protein PilA